MVTLNTEAIPVNIPELEPIEAIVGLALDHTPPGIGSVSVIDWPTQTEPGLPIGDNENTLIFVVAKQPVGII